MAIRPFSTDHERDEIRQCAESLDDFCKRIKTLAPLDEKVVHRASRRARVLDQSGVIPDLATQPSWTKDWKDFTKVFAAIVNDKPAAPRGAATVKRLNQTFGSRAVCWKGRVVEIEFGKQPYIEIDMPPTPESKTERFEGLGNLVLFLRLGRSPGVCMSEAGTPQVVTTRDAWRDVHPGYRIQFLMMIAPGHGHDISCIDAKAMALHDCGAHVLKIIDRGSLTKSGRRRQARASRSRSPSRT